MNNFNWSNTSNGLFTVFINDDNAVQNYLVPAGGTTVLINLQSGKLFVKSVNQNGMPQATRIFGIKEITPQATNGDVVGRQEFNSLLQSFNSMSQQINALVAEVKKKGETK